MLEIKTIVNFNEIKIRCDKTNDNISLCVNLLFASFSLFDIFR